MAVPDFRGLTQMFYRANMSLEEHQEEKQHMAMIETAPKNAARRPETSPRYWVEDRVEVIDGYAWADFIPQRGNIIPVCLGKAEDVVPAARGDTPVPEELSGMRRAILEEALEEVKEERKPEDSTVRRFSFQRVAARGPRARSRR